jgi:hypothetical protein
MNNPLDNSLHQAELLLEEAAKYSVLAAEKARAADQLIQQVRYGAPDHKPHPPATKLLLFDAHLASAMSAENGDNAHELARSALMSAQSTRPLP